MRHLEGDPSWEGGGGVGLRCRARSRRGGGEPGEDVVEGRRRSSPLRILSVVLVLLGDQVLHRRQPDVHLLAMFLLLARVTSVVFRGRVRCSRLVKGRSRRRGRCRVRRLVHGQRGGRLTWPCREDLHPAGLTLQACQGVGGTSPRCRVQVSSRSRERVRSRLTT